VRPLTDLGFTAYQIPTSWSEGRLGILDARRVTRRAVHGVFPRVTQFVERGERRVTPRDGARDAAPAEEVADGILLCSDFKFTGGPADWCMKVSGPKPRSTISA
jgi:hypothetical protein